MQYQYDNAGNMLNDSDRQYSYDGFNRTAKVTTNDGKVQVNKYDAEGLRYEIEENNRLVQFIFNENKEVVVEQTDENLKRLIRSFDLWASECTKEKTWYHYASDEQGSTIFVADENEIKNRYEYDAWGNAVVCEETVENRFKYTGQQYDSVTQQYYLRARYYNPVIARFTQEDVYRGDGLNLYAYCDNNPVMYYDPSGYAKHLKDAVGKGKTDEPSATKRIEVGESGHHVPAVRKSRGRSFEVGRADKTRPTLFSRGADPGHDHWRLHNAEKDYIGPRQGDFHGTDKNLFDAYREAYKTLDDIKVDVRSPNGTHILGENITPSKAVDLMQKWLKENGLWSN